MDMASLSISKNRSTSPDFDQLSLSERWPTSTPAKISSGTDGSGFDSDFRGGSDSVVVLSELSTDLSRISNEMSGDFVETVDLIKHDILDEICRHEDALFEFEEIHRLQGGISGALSKTRGFNSQFFYKSGYLNAKGIITFIEEKVFPSLPDTTERRKRWEIGLKCSNGIWELLQKYVRIPLDEVLECVESVLEKMSVVPSNRATNARSWTDHYSLFIDKRYLSIPECQFLSTLCEYLDLHFDVGYFDEDLIFHLVGSWADLNHCSNWPQIWLDFEQMPLVGLPKREKNAVEVRFEELLSDGAPALVEGSPKESLLVVSGDLSKEFDMMHLDLAKKAHLLLKLKESSRGLREKVVLARTKCWYISGNLTVHNLLERAYERYSGQGLWFGSRVPAPSDERMVLRKWTALVKESSHREIHLLGFGRKKGELPGIIHDLYVKSRKIDWISGGETWRDREKEKSALLIYPKISGGDQRAISVLTGICVDLGITYEVVDSM